MSKKYDYVDWFCDNYGAEDKEDDYGLLWTENDEEY